MRTRRNVLILAVCLAAVVTFIALMRLEREPSFKGRRLSDWIDRSLKWEEGFPEHAEAENAVRTIGPRAVPQLLRWIAYQRPAWKDKLPEAITPSRWRLRWIFHEQFCDRAPKAFCILGPEAAMAVPELTRLLNKPNGSEVPHRAAEALGYIGKQSIPALLAGLTNHDANIRTASILAGIPALGTNAEPALPVLIQALDTADPIERGRIIYVLSRSQLQPELVVPALASCLDDPSSSVRIGAAEGLGLFGRNASGVASRLRNLLQDQDQHVREAATTALNRIALGPFTNAPAQ